MMRTVFILLGLSLLVKVYGFELRESETMHTAEQCFVRLHFSEPVEPRSAKTYLEVQTRGPYGYPDFEILQQNPQKVLTIKLPLLPRELSIRASKELSSTLGNSLQKGLHRRFEVLPQPSSIHVQPQPVILADRPRAVALKDQKLAVRVYLPQWAEFLDSRYFQIQNHPHLKLSSLSWNPDRYSHDMQSPAKVDLMADFEPGEQVKLTLKKGFRIQNTVLKSDLSYTLTMPDYKPSITRAEAYSWYPVQSPNPLFQTLNVDSIEARVLTLLDQNRRYYASLEPGYHDLSRYSSPLATVKRKLPPSKNEMRPLQLDLRPYLKTRPFGLFQIQIEAKAQPEGFTAAHEFQITNHIPSLFQSTEEALVQLRDVQTAMPIPDATIRVLDRKNSIVAKGLTDKDGVFGFKNQAEAVAVLSSKRAMQSLMRLDPNRIQKSLDSTPSLRSFFLQSRKLYRKHERIQGLLLLRTSNQEIPSIGPITLQLKQPGSQPHLQFTTHLNRLGSIAVDIPITSKMPTGTFSLILRANSETVGQHSLRIADFSPPGMKVTGSAQSFDDGKTRLSAQVQYGYGGAAADQPVAFKSRISPLESAPQKHCWFSHQSNFQTQTVEFSAQTSTTGTTSVTLQLQRWQEDAGPFQIHTQLTSRENARSIGATMVTTARAQAPVLKICLPHSKHRFPKNQVFRFEPQTTGTQSTSGASTVFYELQSRSYQPVTDARGRIRFESVWQTQSSSEARLFETTSIHLGAAGDHRIRLLDPSGGDTLLYQFTVSGDSSGIQPETRAKKVVLQVLNPPVRPGKVLQVQIRSPFRGQLLLLLADHKHRYHQNHPLKQENQVVELPVPEDASSRVFLQAHAVRRLSPKKELTPLRATGFKTLIVEHPQSYEALKLPLNPIQRSDQTLSFRLPLTEEEAAMACYADQAILRVQSQRQPHPREWMKAPEALQYGIADPYDRIRTEGQIGDSIRFGGDFIADQKARQLEAPAVLSRQKATVAGCVQPTRTGPDQARFDIPIPPFQGHINLEVLQLKPEGIAFGQTEIQIQDPVVLHATVPPFMAPGDKALISVTTQITTTTAEPSNLVARVESTNSAPTTMAFEKLQSLQLRAQSKDIQVEISIWDGQNRLSRLPLEVPVLKEAPWQRKTELILLKAHQSARIEAPMADKVQGRLTILGHPAEARASLATEFLNLHWNSLRHILGRLAAHFALGRIELPQAQLDLKNLKSRLNVDQIPDLNKEELLASAEVLSHLDRSFPDGKKNLVFNQVLSWVENKALSVHEQQWALSSLRRAKRLNPANHSDAPNLQTHDFPYSKPDFWSRFRILMQDAPSHPPRSVSQTRLQVNSEAVTAPIQVQHGDHIQSDSEKWIQIVWKYRGHPKPGPSRTVALKGDIKLQGLTSNETIKQGNVLNIEASLRSPFPLQQAVMVLPLAAGLELDSDLESMLKLKNATLHRVEASSTRIAVFFSAQKTFRLQLPLRAVTRGHFILPALRIESLQPHGPLLVTRPYPSIQIE